jgi:hypothetical protein
MRIHLEARTAATAAKGRPKKMTPVASWALKDNVEREVIRVLLGDQRTHYFQFELPQIFKSAESWLCVTTVTPREFGKHMLTVGFKKVYKRVVNIDGKKKARSWRAVYVRSKSAAL